MSFETFPDISRKLDTILRILNDQPDTLNRLQSQQKLIMDRLTQSPQIIETQHLPFDPQTGHQVKTPAWQSVLRTPQPVVYQSNTRVESLLDQLSQRINAVENQRFSSSSVQDLSPILVALNDGISSLKQTISMKTVDIEPIKKQYTELTNLIADLQNKSENEAILQRIYQAVSDLIGQSNDNHKVITGLQEAINNANTLLMQNINYRGNDIQQLINENNDLRNHLKKVLSYFNTEGR
jgi:hypothetical protein